MATILPWVAQSHQQQAYFVRDVVNTDNQKHDALTSEVRQQIGGIDQRFRSSQERLPQIFVFDLTSLPLDKPERNPELQWLVKTILAPMYKLGHPTRRTSTLNLDYSLDRHLTTLEDASPQEIEQFKQSLLCLYVLWIASVQKRVKVDMVEMYCQQLWRCRTLSFYMKGIAANLGQVEFGDEVIRYYKAVWESSPGT